MVGRASRGSAVAVGEQVSVERPAKGVGGEDVQASVVHERGDVAVIPSSSCGTLGRIGCCGLRRRGCGRPAVAGEVDQMGAFGVVEL